MPSTGKHKKGGCPYGSGVDGAARKRKAKSTSAPKSKSHSRKTKSKSHSRKTKSSRK